MQQQKKVDVENVRHPVSQLVRLHVLLETRNVQMKKINSKELYTVPGKSLERDEAEWLL